MTLSESPLIVLAGPTGVGKTSVSIDLARALRGEIVNYDSVQVYRGFDIGSAKPTAAERAAAPHHLFDFVEATDDYTAARYREDAERVCGEIRARGNVAILTGGTFFYLRALLSGLPEMPPRDDTTRARLDRINARPRGRDRLRALLRRVDPVSSERIAGNDWHRIQRALEVFHLTGRPISSWQAPDASAPRIHRALVFALQIDREALRARLDARTRAMYEHGLIEETAALLSRYPRSARPFEAIGYREAVRHLQGELSLPDAIAETTRRTRAYAKRQMTWLRAERDVEWIDASQNRESIVRQIIATYRNEGVSR